MKKLILLTIGVWAGMACTRQANDEFVIRGTLDSPFTGTVYLGHIDGRYTHIDSVKLNNESSFSFTRQTDRKDNYRIDFQPYQSGYEIIAEPGGNYELKAGCVQVVQGEEQKLKNSYLEKIKPLEDEGLRLTREYEKAYKENNSQMLSELQQKLTINWEKKEEANIDFIKQHPDSYTAVEIAGDLLLREYPGWKEVYETIDTLNYTYSYAYQSFKEKMEKARSVWMQDQPAPYFETTDIKGKKVTLKDFKGKYLLLDFWASWCRPCRDKAKEIKKIYPQLQAKGIAMCGISIDDNRAQWLKASKEDGIIWTNTCELKDFRHHTIAKEYKVEQIPALFLINPEGIIIKQNPSIEYLMSLPEKP